MAPEPVSPVLDLLGLSGEVLPGLRDRLFDLTRRNRMLYFRPTLGALDLSALTRETRTPLIEDASLARQLVSGGGVRLDAELGPQTVRRLKTLAAQARRDEAEYGVSSLHLITSFLRRPDPDEPDRTVRSPLLLIPVELARDGSTFQLRTTADEAVVNPVLRFDLERRYGVDLPETWPLARLRQGSMRGRLSGRPGFWVDSGSLTRTTIAYRSSALLRDYRALIDRTYAANGIPASANRGTELLRRYLAYAAAVSIGDASRAREQLSGKALGRFQPRLRARRRPSWETGSPVNCEPGGSR